MHSLITGIKSHLNVDFGELKHYKWSYLHASIYYLLQMAFEV